MFNILIVDDNYEDRELLKLEITNALKDTESKISFYEAPSIKKAREHLNARLFDLMTLDIEFDHLNEGIDALPEFFETYPTLNMIVISGKLNKSEVTEQLFRFTKDNLLKSKRWARHFDVLDKKDDKNQAVKRAYEFAIKHNVGGERIRELFLMAESYLAEDMVDKCLEIYQELQQLVPGEFESKENIQLFKGVISAAQAKEYMKEGDAVVASLLLGHFIEKKLKAYSANILGKACSTLAECGREIERKRLLSKYKLVLFQKLIQLRNKAIHQPMTINEEDFDIAARKIDSLELD